MAIDNGVTPADISELVTHLTFCSGWGNALAAVPVIAEVFAGRGIGNDQLSAADVELLPLSEKAEAMRANAVKNSVGPLSPGVEQFTTDPLFRDFRLRPGLAPRDRSLVTFSALVASGHTSQTDALNTTPLLRPATPACRSSNHPCGLGHDGEMGPPTMGRSGRPTATFRARRPGPACSRRHPR